MPGCCFLRLLSPCPQTPTHPNHIGGRNGGLPAEGSLRTRPEEAGKAECCRRRAARAKPFRGVKDGQAREIGGAARGLEDVFVREDSEARVFRSLVRHFPIT